MQEREITGTSQLGGSVSLDRACLELGKSRRTIYYWIRSGRLRTIRTLGGSQRVVWSSLSAPAQAGPGGEARAEAGGDAAQA